MKNTETSVYEKEGNTLASALLDKRGQGVATGFKIKFTQARKPGLETAVGARPTLEEEAERDARVMLRGEDIEQEIIEKNGGDEPRDLDDLIVKQLKKEFPESFNPTIGKIVQKLPPASQAKGKKYKDWNHGGVIVQSNGKNWVKV